MPAGEFRMNGSVKKKLYGAVALIMALLMVYYFYPQNTPTSNAEKNVVTAPKEQTKEPNESGILIDAAQSQRQLQQVLRENRNNNPQQGFA